MDHTATNKTLGQEQAFQPWFQTATGNPPYPFQVSFACESTLPELVDVPPGLGKTAMAVLGVSRKEIQSCLGQVGEFE